MFRLAKVLNGNTQADIHHIPTPNAFMSGEAVNCTSGKTVSTTATSVPEYITVSYCTTHPRGYCHALFVTENMVFKVEYTGALTPYVGMPVGISTYLSKSDAVTYNTNGKGTVIDISDDKKTVYVRFRK